MLAHGRVLEVLLGSWYPDRAWVNQEWLVGLATAWAQAHGIYLLMELLYGASLICGLAFVASETLRTRMHPLVGCVALAVTGIGAVFFGQDRAQTLVWALFPALILAWRRTPWLAVPICALWANIHGSFPIAVLWMLLHLDRPRIPAFIVSALATLANPLGWNLWAFSFTLAGNSHLGGYVNEWVPAFRDPTGIMLALLALAPLWMLLFSARLRRPLRVGDLAWTTIAALMTVAATRYVLLLLLTTTTALGNAFEPRTLQLSKLWTRVAAAFFSLLIIGLGVRAFRVAPIVADPLFAGVQRGSDFTACAPLVTGKRVFVDNLGTGSRVELAGGAANIDGRVDAFPAAALHESFDVLTAAHDAASIVATSGAALLALDGRFSPSPGKWKLTARCGAIRLYAAASSSRKS